MSTNETYSPGLEGVIGGETAVSTIVDGLSYRGYPVTELAERVTYDEVAYLLLHGDLPTAARSWRLSASGSPRPGPCRRPSSICSRNCRRTRPRRRDHRGAALPRRT